MFNYLPFAAVVSNRIFCTHGGLSPDIDLLRDVTALKRPTPIPEEGPVCDLLWSDPQPMAVGWHENDRGVSYTFGSDCVERFLHMNELDLLCRAHQVVQDGYEFCFNRMCLTIFSAPSYTGDMDNAGAVLQVDKNLKCTMHALKNQVLTRRKK
jgi:serine/threonine-protein phosphatase PP1 catalytic subunit